MGKNNLIHYTSYCFAQVLQRCQREIPTTGIGSILSELQKGQICIESAFQEARADWIKICRELQEIARSVSLNVCSMQGKSKMKNYEAELNLIQILKDIECHDKTFESHSLDSVKLLSSLAVNHHRKKETWKSSGGLCYLSSDKKV